jgi:pyruvyltransferase
MRLHGGDFFSNFGDELSPLVLQYVTGRSIQWAPPHKAEIISVGSILEYVDRRTEHQPWIWGTGLRTEPRPGAVPRVAAEGDRVLAVRGPLSRAALGLAPNSAIGDPGVIAPALGSFTGLRRSGTLFIPHFRTWATVAGRSFLRQAQSLGYTIGNPSLHPLEMMRLIARADFVLSSSLHGVIVANSLGIPVQLVSIPSSGRNEPNFKYQDYFQSIGVGFNAVELDIALAAENRTRLLSAREADVALAQANCLKLAEQLTRAVQRIR